MMAVMSGFRSNYSIKLIVNDDDVGIVLGVTIV